MNHEVENDIDIKRAGREYAKTMGLKKHGAMDVPGSREDGGIESFKVANLQDASEVLRDTQEIIGLGKICRDRLLHENVYPGAERSGGGGVMRVGGDTDGSGVQG
jgi:hypothetical protein